MLPSSRAIALRAKEASGETPHSWETTAIPRADSPSPPNSAGRCGFHRPAAFAAPRSRSRTASNDPSAVVSIGSTSSRTNLATRCCTSLISGGSPKSTTSSLPYERCLRQTTLATCRRAALALRGKHYPRQVPRPAMSVGFCGLKSCAWLRSRSGTYAPGTHPPSRLARLVFRAAEPRKHHRPRRGMPPRSRTIGVVAALAVVTACAPESVTEQGKDVNRLYDFFTVAAAVIFTIT